MAERAIAEGDIRVGMQVATIKALARDGHDTAAAEELLQSLKRMIGRWYAQREQILRAIEREEHHPPS